MRRTGSFDGNPIRTRSFPAPCAAFVRFVNALLGRTGFCVCLCGKKETLYPCMSRRAIRRVAGEICRIAGNRTPP